MNDYSICLIEIEKAIKEYRKAVLANNFAVATQINESIMKLSRELYEWTLHEYVSK